MELTLLIFLILVPFLLLLPVWAATLVWVYRDAEKLGKPGILVALLVGLLCWPVGLLVWLILRADYLKAAGIPAAGGAVPPRGCPRCGQLLAKDTAHGLCPACLLQQATASESGAPNPAAFTPPGVAELAPLFPQLEILELLGRGGMGAVYKARQPALDRVVALKVLPVTPGADPTFAERFQREARALASLNHPHIVNVYDFGQLPTLSWFLMEYVDGVNLRQLERTSRLSPREALAIVPQVCEALQFAHDRGIVHRDIKPENILVDKQGQVKIADFGLAKLIRPEAGGIALTETRHAVGTPQYMAPEQVERPQSVDHRADIYSLGVVFYEMLTGELPLGRFPVPSQRVQVDVRLDEVVLKALEKEPDRRYQQASAFKANVETVTGMPAPSGVQSLSGQESGGRVGPPGQPPVWNDAARPAGAPYPTQAASAPFGNKGDRMNKHRCPHCGKDGISALRHAFLGPGLPTTCTQCGQKVGVPLWSMLTLAPLILGLISGLLFATTPASAAFLVCGGLGLSLLLWVTFVPLVKK